MEKEKILNGSLEYRVYLAEHGSDADRDILLTDCDATVRCAVAIHGNTVQRNRLLFDRNCQVRNILKKVCTESQILVLNSDYYNADFIRSCPDDVLEILTYAPYVFVRKCVAEYGNDRHRDILLTDSSPLVRQYVAHFGNDRQRDALLDDSDPMVLRTIGEHGNAEQIRSLVRRKKISSTFLDTRAESLGLFARSKKGWINLLSREICFIKILPGGKAEFYKDILFGTISRDLQSLPEEQKRLLISRQPVTYHGTVFRLEPCDFGYRISEKVLSASAGPAQNDGMEPEL